MKPDIRTFFFGLLLLGMSACALRSPSPSTDAALMQASRITDQVDAKAVIVRQWLATH